LEPGARVTAGFVDPLAGLAVTVIRFTAEVLPSAGKSLRGVPRKTARML